MYTIGAESTNPAANLLRTLKMLIILLLQIPIQFWNNNCKPIFNAISLESHSIPLNYWFQIWWHSGLNHIQHILLSNFWQEKSCLWVFNWNYLLVWDEFNFLDIVLRMLLHVNNVNNYCKQWLVFLSLKLYPEGLLLNVKVLVVCHRIIFLHIVFATNQFALSHNLKKFNTINVRTNIHFTLIKKCFNLL